MSKKYIMLDLDDEKLRVLADVLNNKTSKVILEYLADKEASEAEIVRDLNLAANTVNYNVRKLIEAGLVETGKNWFWSVKGKKVIRYRVANKKIIISPKSSKNAVSVLSALVATGIIALLIKVFMPSGNNTVNSVNEGDYAILGSEAAKSAVAPSSAGVSDGIVRSISNLNNPQIWIWFLAGGIIALIIFMILNWKKME